MVPVIGTTATTAMTTKTTLSTTTIIKFPFLLKLGLTELHAEMKLERSFRSEASSFQQLEILISVVKPVKANWP